jgi:hypothetical protein
MLEGTMRSGARSSWRIFCATAGVAAAMIVGSAGCANGGDSDPVLGASSGGGDASSHDSTKASNTFDAGSTNAEDASLANDAALVDAFEANDAATKTDASLDANLPTDSGSVPPIDAPVDSSAAVEAGLLRDASTCIDSLSDIGKSDFTLSFTIATTQTFSSAIVNQRKTCAASTFWDVRLGGDGLFGVETDDGPSTYKVFKTTIPVNDGPPHTVVIERIDGTITATIDSVVAGTGPSPASFGVLTPLLIKTDICDGDAGDGTEPFTGSLTNICISSP